MSNGKLWTRAEIAELVSTATGGGDLLGLSTALGRSHEAVIAKAKRLNLPLSPVAATAS